jgi:peptidoglycan/LPS O-acetylase OafA/YrhL
LKSVAEWMKGETIAAEKAEQTTNPGSPSSKKNKHIPSLDGLRAIAITFVVTAHAVQRGAPWISSRAATYLTVLAYTGVKIFFVISGFLITSLLLKELKETGTFSLRRFYWRRTLRIFPAMYVFLFVLGVGYGVGLVPTGHDGPFRIFSAAAYVSDYIPIWGWPLHHTWSLSVEEQFYLLWPVALLVCGLRKAAIFPAILIVIAIVSRTVAYGEYRFDTVADSLAIGCLASIYRKPAEKFLLRILPRTFPLAVLLLLPILLLPAANHYSRHPVFSSLVGIPLLNLGVGIAMIAVIVRPPSWLNSGPLVGLGHLSYSLYLWHLPWVRDFRFGWLWLPAALLCAWLSYGFVEQPVLRWRDQHSQFKARRLTDIPHE